MPHELITHAEGKMQEALKHLASEFSGIRTGRAHPALVETILVDSYGAKTPLKAVASITILDAATIAVQPWDKSLMSVVEKALRDANLGAQPINDGQQIRISLPAPTEEQRKGLCKKVQEFAEHGRIAVRTARSESHSQMKKLKEASDLTEDDFYSMEKELQKIVDAMNASIEQLAEKKEKEIMTF